MWLWPVFCPGDIEYVVVKGAHRKIDNDIHWASVSEPPLVDSTDALSRYIYIYIDVRTFTDTAHARRYAQT